MYILKHTYVCVCGMLWSVSVSVSLSVQVSICTCEYLCVYMADVHSNFNDMAIRFRKRQRIRETWGRYVPAVFLVGKKAPAGGAAANAAGTAGAAATHVCNGAGVDDDCQDVLYFDIYEGYGGASSSLPRKVFGFVHAVLQHAAPAIMFLIKVDHDTVLNDDFGTTIARRVEALAPPVYCGLKGGKNQYSGKPRRDPSHKHFIAHATYEPTHYPPYANGSPGYILDRAAAEKVIALAGTAPCMPMEDVFTGIVCAQGGVALQDFRSRKSAVVVAHEQPVKQQKSSGNATTP